MMRDPAWGPVLQAARRGVLPLVRVGASPASVAQSLDGRRPCYLATPYSRKVVDAQGIWDHHRSVQAMIGAARAAADLLQVGITAISPIVQAAAMLHAKSALVGQPDGGTRWIAGIDPLDGALWQRWCAPLLAVSAAVVVPDLAGWDRSVGIWVEVRFALDHDIPVFVYGDFVGGGAA